jgi:hypothetical protein
MRSEMQMILSDLQMIIIKLKHTQKLIFGFYKLEALALSNEDFFTWNKFYVHRFGKRQNCSPR